MRGVPLVVVGPDVTPPVADAQPFEGLPGVAAVEFGVMLLFGARALPPGKVVPWFCVCDGSGEGWPGAGAAGLPVTCPGRPGLVGPVVPGAPGVLGVGVAAVPALPVPPVAPPDVPPAVPPVCAIAVPAIMARVASVKPNVVTLIMSSVVLLLRANVAPLALFRHWI